MFTIAHEPDFEGEYSFRQVSEVLPHSATINSGVIRARARVPDFRYHDQNEIFNYLRLCSIARKEFKILVHDFDPFYGEFIKQRCLTTIYMCRLACINGARVFHTTQMGTHSETPVWQGRMRTTYEVYREYLTLKFEDNNGTLSPNSASNAEVLELELTAPEVVIFGELYYSQRQVDWFNSLVDEYFGQAGIAWCIDFLPSLPKWIT